MGAQLGKCLAQSLLKTNVNVMFKIVLCFRFLLMDVYSETWTFSLVAGFTR